MRIVPVDTVPLIERQHVREGIFRSRTLLTGTPGAPDNFTLQLVSLPGAYNSPRHRHNFDQVRWQIEGEFDFSHDGVMRPGTIAYFPEGTKYGPQKSTEPTTTLVLQFGGASGSGYISAEEYEQARTELSKSGSFAGGVYTRAEGEGRRTQDAYEAVWERVNGRPLEYPEPRYGRPVFMETDHFEWVPQNGAGTARKLLGVFSERGTRLAMFRASAGTKLPLEDHALYFIHAGAGSVNGKAFTGQTVVHVERGEAASLDARSDTELLQLGLPRLGSGM